LTLTQAQQNRKIIGALGDQLSAFSIPLFIAERPNKPPRLVGTGFIFPYASQHYLISAAHVLEEHYQDGQSIHYYIQPGIPHRLDGPAFLTSPSSGNRDDDIIDVGIVRLESPLPMENTLKQIVPFERLKTGMDHVGEKVYMAIGYPATQINPDYEAKTFSPSAMVYWNRLADEEIYKRKGLSTKSHILIEYDRKRSMLSDDIEGTTPDPRGMSGCPVWCLGDLKAIDVSGPTPIVGIAIEHDRENKCMVAVDIAYALVKIKDFIAETSG